MSVGVLSYLRERDTVHQAHGVDRGVDRFAVDRRVTAISPFHRGLESELFTG